MLAAASSARVSVSPPHPKQPVWTNTAGLTPASVRSPATSASGVSPRKARWCATRPAGTRRAAPTAATSAARPSKVPAVPSSSPTLAPPAGAAHASACVCVSSQGAAARPPAAPQRPEEVPVFRLRLQVHPTGEVGGALRLGRAALRARLNRRCRVCVWASRLT